VSAAIIANSIKDAPPRRLYGFDVQFVNHTERTLSPAVCPWCVESKQRADAMEGKPYGGYHRYVVKFTTRTCDEHAAEIKAQHGAEKAA
jgi:hypothetical protein